MTKERSTKCWKNCTQIPWKPKTEIHHA